ncbi:hypothetical protein PInf_005902 [Phytophthora infestans]|nr:hypothetical protein PInf_005902 [Phytophthora infestans]
MVHMQEVMKTSIRKQEKEQQVVGAEEVDAEVVGAEWVAVGEEQRIDQYMQDMEAIEEMEGMKLPLCHPVFTWARNLVVPMVTTSPTLLSIILRAAERVDAVILTIVNPAGEENTFYHGGFGGVLKTPLTLAQGEYITVMEAHEGKHKGRTRVKYIKFTTNLGNFIEGGTRTDKTGSDTAEDGYQLGGFAGRSGDELDLVSAIWTSIQPVV